MTCPDSLIVHADGTIPGTEDDEPAGCRGRDERLSDPGDVAVDASGNLYASNSGNNTITEYGPGASGDIAPFRTISGPNTGLFLNDDISLASDGTLYVGNVSPSATFPVVVFAPGAHGSATPIRNIGGMGTGLSGPSDVEVGLGGDLFVANGGFPESVEVFAAGANGPAAPLRVITGSNTGLQFPDDLATDASGKVYVTNGAVSSAVPGSVVVFAAGANNNVAPQTTLFGPTTTLVTPEGIAVAPAPVTHSPTIFQVELRNCTNLHVGYNYFPAGRAVRWNVAQNNTVVAHGQFTTLGGGKTYHFLTQPLGVTVQTFPDGHVHFHWTINNATASYTAIRDPGC
jgi:hypothetical protein